ncbi:MAG: hypothetical protein JST64_14935, partial [Actinobacteria bacterium]|nr:hypothetical protein [Actinomycetota bacterium]
MSDVPQGADWWQASDLKWYPPSQQPGAGGGAKRGWVAPTVVLVVVAMVAAVAAFVLVNRGDDASAAGITLEPAGAVGADPFTESVTIGEVATFPEGVKATAAGLTAKMRTDEHTGALVTTGTTPGLFGGTRSNAA